MSCLILCALCSKEYLEAVKQTPHMTLEELLTFTQQYGDVYFHPVSHDFAGHHQRNIFFLLVIMSSCL